MCPMSCNDYLIQCSVIVLYIMHAMYIYLLHICQLLDMFSLPCGRTSRVWESLLVMKSGCAGGRGLAPRPGQ